jgi:hypothetical protein
MIGRLGWPPDCWERVSLRELIVADEAAMMDRYDRMSMTLELLDHQLYVMQCFAGTKNAARPRDWQTIHPMRPGDRRRHGRVLTPANLHEHKEWLVMRGKR